MTKGEVAKKGFCKISLEALEKEIKVSPSGPSKEEGQLGTF